MANSLLLSKSQPPQRSVPQSRDGTAAVRRLPPWPNPKVIRLPRSRCGASCNRDILWGQSVIPEPSPRTDPSKLEVESFGTVHRASNACPDTDASDLCDIRIDLDEVTDLNRAFKKQNQPANKIIDHSVPRLVSPLQMGGVISYQKTFQCPDF